MTISSHTIAPHLREHIFRAYEPLLHTAVAAWPQETSFDVPADVASSTFLANLRNAVVSLSRYNWPTNIDRKKFDSLLSPRAFTIVFGDDGKVWFRAPRKPIAKSLVTTTVSRPGVPTGPANPGGVVPWGDWTEAELEALVLLIDKQRITGPVLLAGTVKPELVEHYQSIFNVALVHDAERNVTIVT